jgi:hypothetical protein
MILPPLKDLRAQLAAVINTSQHPGHSSYNDHHRASSSASPHEHHLDPAISGGGGMMSAGGAAGDSGGDDNMGDGRKGGKRELSQSKRAAQNRAAQVCLIFMLAPLYIDDVRGETNIWLRIFRDANLRVLLCHFSCHQSTTIHTTP